MSMLSIMKNYEDFNAHRCKAEEKSRKRLDKTVRIGYNIHDEEATGCRLLPLVDYAKR